METMRGKPDRASPSAAPGEAGRADPEERVSILLVDDRPENLLALEAILSELDQDIVTARSGREALRFLLDQEFAVILLDVKMPEMDGFETATLIRSREHSQHTPIIFVTALDRNEGQLFKGYSSGAVDYIFKPIDPEILRAKVQVFIDLYQKTSEVRRLNEHLEERVRERTQELEQANRVLNREIADRKRAEAEVRSLNAELEERVRERTQELEQANQELESFSYSISHDLRAPLRKVATFSDLLLEESTDHLDADGRHYLARIRAATQRMEELIEDMLKLSKVSRNDLDLAEVDLTALADRLAGELRTAHPEQEVVFEREEGLTAETDPRLIEIALQNLLENAWKFTSKQPHPRVTFGRTEQDGTACFFLQDNGAGFDSAHMDRLFLPFQRLHAYSEFPGTGIGLAIVQRVISRHGGRIWADAAPGEGATFYFTISPQSEVPSPKSEL